MNQKPGELQQRDRERPLPREIYYRTKNSKVARDEESSGRSEQRPPLPESARDEERATNTGRRINQRAALLESVRNEERAEIMVGGVNREQHCQRGQGLSRV